ncbi:cupin-like domain-containing protein [Aliiglaciecola sp. 3_MG-2023]|uniref:cupin-like domain-containing protein n=1 Tax=Aliiglaciecola sp. 3_MG-2023 TaxID=3062644 RepID=UPI0026E128BD|nr:cupin-like domain-containing protein [Aliiglaciecola sp. 3_MG-2023]MDO6693034.1 cupin-like domain-containing protein [Aliiglaciecola sp. 3_MG-2023]
MLSIKQQTEIITDCQPGKIPTDIHQYSHPVVLKGLVKHWELVEIGLESAQKSVDYLKSFYNGKPVFAYFGAPEIEGKYAYNENATKLNYESKKAKVDEVLELIIQHLYEPQPPSYYIASNVIDTNFPGLTQENNLHIPVAKKQVATEPPVASIWIGNKSIARCHYDASDNIACVVSGKRRFITFPPDQIANLYPGPLAPTPGGPVITMVDLHNPDFEKYPKIKEALAHGQVAELEPGDAIYIPSMWWHQVEALSPYNILVNYWWSDAEKYMGAAMNVLYHAMLSLRDKPAHEKAGWKHVFDYYIFGEGEQPTEHLPPEAQGFLGPMNEIMSRQLRSMLINKLNR